MRATVYHGTGDVRVENVPDPVIKQPTDAIVRITHACICGSDLWFYRGLDNWKPGWRTGHEWMGIVEEVGSEVRNIKKGDQGDGATIILRFSTADERRCRRPLGGFPQGTQIIIAHFIRVTLGL